MLCFACNPKWSPIFFHTAPKPQSWDRTLRKTQLWLFAGQCLWHSWWRDGSWYQRSKRLINLCITNCLVFTEKTEPKKERGRDRSIFWKKPCDSLLITFRCHFLRSQLFSHIAIDQKYQLLIRVIFLFFNAVAKLEPNEATSWNFFCW